GDLPCTRYGGQGMPIAQWLANGHDIRYHAVQLKAPKGLAHPAATHLYLIGNAEPARGPYISVGLCQKTFWQFYLPPATDDRLHDQGADPTAIFMDDLDLFPYFFGVAVARFVAPVFSSKCIGQRKDMGVLGGPLSALAIELIGADVYAHIGISMVAHLRGDNVPLSRG